MLLLLSFIIVYVLDNYLFYIRYIVLFYFSFVVLMINFKLFKKHLGSNFLNM